MHTKLSLSGKNKRFLIMGCVGLIVLVMIVAVLRSCTKSEPTVEEVRMQHLDWMVKLVETYKQRFGSYPQPTARAQTAEGIRHAWGYRAGVPSLASCTVAFDDSGAVIAEKSACGGGVFDVDGNLIGWKGTLTVESGLNSVEIAERGSGRVESPVSEMVEIVPTDPVFTEPAYASIGLGEYVYAVRNPDAPGANGRDEYQIAMTATDPSTGEKRTVVRGNYFVRSDEKDKMPASLIGPGLLFDEFNNPLGDQSRPLHSLIDGQKYGFPNPVLGEGEDVMQFLMLSRRAKKLLSEIERRIVSVSSLPVDLSESVSALESDRERARQIINSLESESGRRDLSSYESELNVISDDLTGVVNSFASAYATKVETVLAQEVDDRDKVLSILGDVFELSKKSEDFILIARDEILNYLDGEGIEEQTRQRVGRKLKSVLDDLPDIDQMFMNADLVPMRVFSEEDERSGSGSVMLNTVYSELYVHLSEFKQIVDTLLDDVINGGVELSDFDSSLTKLMQALTSEDSRINSLFNELADTDTAIKILADFRLLMDDNPLEAIKNAASASGMNGDFQSLIFDATTLENVALERAPGIPDVGIVEDELMAEYKGIPYPLP